MRAWRELRSSHKHHARLWLLVAAHVILGSCFSILSAAVGLLSIYLEFLLVIPVFGFLLAQASLLGVWVAFSQAMWWVRLVSLIVGSVYLEFLLRIGGQVEDDFFLLPTMATVGLATIFAAVRWRFADVRRLTNGLSEANDEGLKFSIRGLMLFTFVVAFSIIGIRTLRENMPSGPNFLFMVIWSLGFTVTGTAAVWAALGVVRPLARSLIVLLVSAVLGFVFGYIVVGLSDFLPYF